MGAGSIPAAPLPFQVPACGPGEQLRMAQSFGTLHSRGRPGKGSWLRIGIASAFALTWGVNHQKEDVPLCLSSMYIHLSNKKYNKNKCLKKCTDWHSRSSSLRLHFSLPTYSWGGWLTCFVFWVRVLSLAFSLVRSPKTLCLRYSQSSPDSCMY